VCGGLAVRANGLGAPGGGVSQCPRHGDGGETLTKNESKPTSRTKSSQIRGGGGVGENRRSDKKGDHEVAQIGVSCGLGYVAWQGRFGVVGGMAAGCFFF